MSYAQLWQPISSAGNSWWEEGSRSAFAVLILGAVGAHKKNLSKEEACLKQYGESYKIYMERIPRYFLFFLDGINNKYEMKMVHRIGFEFACEFTESVNDA